MSGSSARVDQTGGATFEGAKFELKDRNARGAADRIQVTRDQQLKLNGVRYTTCPVGEEDWVLRASDIDIRQRAGLGFGRSVRLDFKGVPILYTPFISFPVGNQRKSGFLFPTLGTSSRSGTSLSVPWYWNIAPNYDATFLPTWFTKRGGKLDGEFRYLTDLGRGTLTAEYLPDDEQFGDSRSFVRFVDRSDFTDSLRLDIDAANVGDSDWFEDFGLGPGGHEHQLSRSLGQPHVSHAALAGGAARAELPDDRRPRHRCPSCGRIPCCRSWQCTPPFPTSWRTCASVSTWSSATSRTTSTTALQPGGAWTWRRKSAGRCAARAATWSRLRAGATRPIDSTTWARRSSTIRPAAPRRSRASTAA